VANEWKDENDKVMPVKQWLEERRIMQVYFPIRIFFGAHMVLLVQSINTTTSFSDSFSFSKTKITMNKKIIRKV